MWFTVLHAGVPLGTVELPATELAAGRLVRLAGYGALAARIRSASAALLEFGFYGPPVSAISDPARRRARMSLLAGATLALELRTFDGGELAPTRFVNLIEAPENREVVVVARFREVHAGVPADTTWAAPPGSLTAVSISAGSVRRK